MISIVSETLPHLKRGAIRDFLSIMQEHNYYKDALWNKTDFTYTFETGSKIEFFSADQPDKVRGPRRDVLFINEANNISFETYTQLEIRTRKIIWLDWNPVSEFWWYLEVQPHTDVDFLILTYKDNEALDQSIIDSIENRRHNKQWFKVYGEGQLGEAEERIYTGWGRLDEVPEDARLVRRGLDFGYTNDPTAIIGIYRWNGGFIVDEEVYQKALSNKDIVDKVKPLNKVMIIADSAEPKSIDEIGSYGVFIQGAQKGQGSVNQGIQFVQQQKIWYTKRSTNVIKEYRNYLWITNKDGKVTNEPVGIWDHAMSAIRYALEGFRPTGPQQIHSALHVKETPDEYLPMVNLDLFEKTRNNKHK